MLLVILMVILSKSQPLHQAFSEILAAISLLIEPISDQINNKLLGLPVALPAKITFSVSVQKVLHFSLTINLKLSSTGISPLVSGPINALLP